MGIWLPDVLLACFGYFYVVGPMTLAVLPMTLLLYFLLYRRQKRTVFVPLALTPRRDIGAFLLFATVYQAFMSAMAVRRYAQYLLNRRLTWK